MNPELIPSTVTISLSLEAHTRANQFRRYHVAEKAKQVYLNTLAVYAVDIYLQRLGFVTDWKSSASANPLIQRGIDVADLATDRGVLECRPVLVETAAAAADVYIPAEVWDDRIGYVAVQLDQTLREATLLGFIETVATEKVRLSELKSLDTLPAYLNSINPLVVSSSEPSSSRSTHLSQWLHDQIDTTWQTIEELFGLQIPAWQYRHSATAKWMSRGKILNFGDALPGQVALVIEVASTGETEANISVKICPTQAQAHLPANLELMVLDEAGVAVIQAQARSTEMINVEFSGEWGDRFSTKVIWGEVNVIDTFVI